MSIVNQLWEIYVPCVFNDGAPVRTRHHREWDRQVRQISGGLTVLKPAVGQWENEGRLFHERVIPVRIAATRAEMEQVAAITIRHYEQLAVMYYLVSEECVVHYAGELEQARFVRKFTLEHQDGGCPHGHGRMGGDCPECVREREEGAR